MRGVLFARTVQTFEKTCITLWKVSVEYSPERYSTMGMASLEEKGAGCPPFSRPRDKRQILLASTSIFGVGFQSITAALQTSFIPPLLRSHLKCKPPVSSLKTKPCRSPIRGASEPSATLPVSNLRGERLIRMPRTKHAILDRKTRTEMRWTYFCI